MRDYRELNVWKKSHDLTLQVYQLTDLFPQEERASLTTQIRRACYSIPANIAEGCGKINDAELVRCLDISSGYASELDYLLLLANDLGLMTNEVYQKISGDLVEIRKMLTSFIKSQRRPIHADPQVLSPNR